MVIELEQERIQKIFKSGEGIATQVCIFSTWKKDGWRPQNSKKWPFGFKIFYQEVATFQESSHIFRISGFILIKKTM